MSTEVEKCPLKKNKISKHTCSVTVDLVTALDRGFQTLPAGTVISGTSFGTSALSDPAAYQIIGYQIPDNCETLGNPIVKKCAVERVCPDGTVHVGGVIESCVRLTPVISRPLGFVFSVTLLGLPVVRRILQPFHCTIIGSTASKEYSDCQGSCQTKWKVCSCEICPIVNCLVDTSQAIVTATLGSTVIPNQTVCIATSFRQLNAVSISTRQCRKPIKIKQPKLVSVTPSCVNLPLLGVTAAANTTETCVTLNGCHLQNTVAVVFNQVVCVTVLSVSNKSIQVIVPCAVPRLVPPGGMPTPALVAIAAIDSCGRFTNAITLQINCPRQ